MRAEIDTKFTRGFFLSEESIKKIEELVTKRLKPLNEEEPFSLSLEAHRVDDAVITYDCSTALIEHEENARHDSLKGLNIFAEGRNAKFTLDFEKGEKTRLRISSDTRDLALLLSADIKEYLKSEVLVRRLAFLSNLFSHRLTFPFVYLMTFVPILIISQLIRKQPDLPLSSASISQKMDYLISSNKSAADFLIVPNYALISVVVVLVILALFSTSAVFPAYTFYFGKEKAKFDSQKLIRNNVFWICGVGLIVGVVGSLLAGWIKI